MPRAAADSKPWPPATSLTSPINPVILSKKNNHFPGIHRNGPVLVRPIALCPLTVRLRLHPRSSSFSPPHHRAKAEDFTASRKASEDSSGAPLSPPASGNIFPSSLVFTANLIPQTCQGNEQSIREHGCTPPPTIPQILSSCQKRQSLPRLVLMQHNHIAFPGINQNDPVPVRPSPLQKTLPKPPCPLRPLVKHLPVIACISRPTSFPRRVKVTNRAYASMAAHHHPPSPKSCHPVKKDNHFPALSSCSTITSPSPASTKMTPSLSGPVRFRRLFRSPLVLSGLW